MRSGPSRWQVAVRSKKGAIHGGNLERLAPSGERRSRRPRGTRERRPREPSLDPAQTSDLHRQHVAPTPPDHGLRHWCRDRVHHRYRGAGAPGASSHDRALRRRRSLGGGTGSRPYPDGRLVEAPALVLILTVAMLIIAWTYLLSGALHAHWSLRIAGIAAFSLAMWSQRSLVAGHGSAYIAALLLGALWLWGLLTVVWDREQGRRGNHDKRHGSRVTWTTFAAVLGIVTGLFVVGFSSASRTGSNLEFTVNLSAQLTLLAVYLVPILLVAGVDFAEWGEIL